MEWEWVTDNPLLQIAKEKVRNGIKRWLTTEEVQRLLACGFSTLASGDHCVRAPYGNATRGDSGAVMVPRGSGVPYAHDPGAENRIVRHVADE